MADEVTLQTRYKVVLTPSTLPEAMTLGLTELGVSFRHTRYGDNLHVFAVWNASPEDIYTIASLKIVERVEIMPTAVLDQNP